MSKKTDSKSTKIGINQLWNTKSQKYGNNLYNFNIFLYNYKNNTNFVLRSSALKTVFINKIRLTHKNNLFTLKLYVKNVDKLNVSLLKNYFYWFYLKRSLAIKLYNNGRVNNTYVLSIYAKYLFTYLNYSAKKILIILTLILNENKNLKKIVFLKNGPINLVFKGYKIKLSGRIDNQKNQMAKNITLKKGSLNSTSLNSYVDFKNINLNTKLGICNIKIWLFYQNLEINEKNSKQL